MRNHFTSAVSRSILLTVIALSIARAAGGVAQTRDARCGVATPAAPGSATRFAVGRAAIFALADGTSQRDINRYNGISRDGIVRRLRAVDDEPPEDGWYNAFLVEVGDRRVLIDAGAGESPERPGGGQLPRSLAAAGIAPESIDAIVLSHSHADHVGGLLDSNCSARFPRATLHPQAAERRFWLGGHETESARRILAAYRGRVRVATGTIRLAQGLTAEPIVGHTPGHMIVRLRSRAAQMLFLGDMFHSATLQAPLPTVTLNFDADQNTARSARLAFLRANARPGTLFAAPHFPSPGVARLTPSGDGYCYVLQNGDSMSP